MPPMINFNIPGMKHLEIKHVVLDFNGTIATDGRLINGVKEGIDEFSSRLKFHVITADTFGSVKDQLNNVEALLTVISSENQAQKKLDYLKTLGTRQTICVGNGVNDTLILKESIIGIAVLGEEGAASSALSVSDLMVKNILDVFGFFRTPERLVATLRI